VDVHKGRERQEILNIKMYADAVLGELLKIHKPADVAAVAGVKTACVKRERIRNALTLAHIFRFPNVPDGVFVSLNKPVCALSVM
jgi:hypothetical protein